MKWARVKPSGKDATGGKQGASPGDQESFSYYRSEDELNKVFVKPQHLWCNYDFKYSFASDKRYDKFQRRYQIYCGGFLTFYDTIVRSGAVDHEIYFVWTPYNKKGVYNVKIYIIPPPQLPLSNGGAYAKKASGANVALKAVPGPAPVPTAAAKGGAIDPPRTPPPPPPSMEDLHDS